LPSYSPKKRLRSSPSSEEKQKPGAQIEFTVGSDGASFLIPFHRAGDPAIGKGIRPGGRNRKHQQNTLNGLAAKAHDSCMVGRPNTKLR
jgi:hypothetical protein